MMTMERFKNILVGVDLSEADRFVSDRLAAPSMAAVHRAMWLAKANSARVCFMYALDSSTMQPTGDQQQIPEASQDRKTVVNHAQEVLSKLVDDARRQGVTAEHQVAVGKSWVELIRQVLRNNHDLLIAGTRRFGAFRSMLFGSTGIKLLRQCPCPVWITEPEPERLSSILVAHDLEPVGDLAMELGCSMAQRHDAQLHVFHALRFPEMDSMFPSRVSSEDVVQFWANAEQHIAGQLNDFQLSKAAEVHIEFGLAYAQILQLVERHKVELLVMGTVARTGVTGLITGNTAERLLPHIPCSVLAVKPKGFKSPVTLE
jgi:universal stress protein E